MSPDPSPIAPAARFVAWSVSWLAWIVLQFIGKTSRLRVRRHPRYEELLASHRPCIYALWHRFQLLMVYEHRKKGVVVLVSQSRDGELIAQALHRFGFGTVRGSSSRGGGPALARIISSLEEGRAVAFTPDGPRGPFRSVQPGVLAAARQTGAVVVPVAWAGNRVRALDSWDRFLVPFPFGRYEVVFGEPLRIGPNEPGGEDKIRAALDAAAAEAERLLNENKN